jgi:prolyl-tRNA synthetase
MFHIQWKFRDEIRPRFGVMRGREFLMKDAYSFHTDEESAVKEYNNMFKTYLRIFQRLGVKAIPFRADTGMIGGDLSHEFQVIADTGESQIYYDKKFEEIDVVNVDIDELKKLYARADEMHEESTCPIPLEDLRSKRGIEVGHIFYLGDKYSKAMNAAVQGTDGKPQIVKMGCYGIGVSRLLGAIIEASHDEKGIIWPENVAPFKVGLINVKSGDAACDAKCEEVYQAMLDAGVEVLYDDRNEGAGGKFATMDLIGLPIQIAIGPRGLETGVAEFKVRKTGEKKELKIEEIINNLHGLTDEGLPTK